MTRSILAVVAGLVAWMVVATLLNFGLRAGLAGYTQAEPILAFTLGMKIARLTLAALASLAEHRSGPGGVDHCRSDGRHDFGRDDR